MTLDYKILGQLYYGPEINFIPGTPDTPAGYYTETRITTEEIYVTYSGIPGNMGDGPTVIAYSSDGITWTQKVLFDVRLLNVAYDSLNKNFLAAARDRNYRTSYWFSENGLDWTKTYTDQNAYSIPQIVGGNGIFIVYMGYQYLKFTSDGKNFTNILYPYQLFPSSNPAIANIEYSSGKFSIIWTDFNQTHYLRESVDVINWNSFVLPTSFRYVNNFASSNGIEVAIVAYQQDYWQIYFSNDKISFYNVTPPGIENILKVFYSNGFYFIVAQNGLYRSSDGQNYQRISFPSFGSPIGYANLTAANEKLFARFQEYGTGVILGYYLSSDNGQTWSEIGIDSSYIELNVLYSLKTTEREVVVSTGGPGRPDEYLEIVEPQILYTVPEGKQVTVTSVYATNHDIVDRSYDLAVVPLGEDLSLKHHVRWDKVVPINSFDLIDLKITMSSGDSLYVFPSTINKVGFTAFGIEIPSADIL